MFFSNCFRTKSKGTNFFFTKNEKEFQFSNSASEWLTLAESFITKSEYNLKTFLLFLLHANHTQKVVYKIQANGYSVEPVNFTGKKIADAWKSSFLIYSISKRNGSFKPSAHPLSQIND